jgi:hypothetical protein
LRAAGFFTALRAAGFAAALRAAGFLAALRAVVFLTAALAIVVSPSRVRIISNKKIMSKFDHFVDMESGFSLPIYSYSAESVA